MHVNSFIQRMPKKIMFVLMWMNGIWEEKVFSTETELEFQSGIF